MSKSEDFVNKRDLKRHYLLYYLRVFNRLNGEVLGHLVDITTKGVMLLRDSPIEAGLNYSLRLRWRNAQGKLQIADFEGICRWCRPDVNPDFYDAGFLITHAEPETIKSIQSLIGDLGMPDGLQDND